MPVYLEIGLVTKTKTEMQIFFSVSIKPLFFPVLSIEDTAITQRDGSGEAICIRRRADRPSGET